MAHSFCHLPTSHQVEEIRLNRYTIELSGGPYCGMEWGVASKSLINLALQMPVAHRPAKVVDPPAPGLKVAVYEMDHRRCGGGRYVYTFKEWQ